MKKYLLALFSLLVLSHTAWAALTIETDILIDGLTYRFFNYGDPAKDYFVISSPKEGNYSGDIVIPSTVQYNGKTYEVRGIAAYCFCYDRQVTSVTIPNTVTEIGINAFLDCQGLKELTIPSSVKTVGEAAFGACTLQPLNIEGKWSEYAKALSKLNTSSYICAPTTEQSKIRSAFKGTVANPGYNPTPEIDGISYQLNESSLYATVIAKRSGKYSGDISIPDYITSGGKKYKVNEIAAYAFNKCDGLTSVTMSDMVYKLGNYAFANSWNLKKVHLSKGISEIPMYAFSDCQYLEEIDLPANLTSIGREAFYRCMQLKSLSFGPYFKTFDIGAFRNCSRLTDITIDPDNRYLSYEDGMIFDKNKKTLLFHMPAFSTDCVVPEGVETIAEYAFDGSVFCKVTLPNSLQRIENAAFINTGKMETLILPPHLQHIGYSAFYSNYNYLKLVVIPASVTSMNCVEHLFGQESIEKLVFLNSLSKIYHPGNPYHIISLLKPEGTTIYAHGSEIDLIKEVFKGEVVNIDDQLATLSGTVKSYIRGLEFDLTYGADNKLQSVTVGDKTVPRTADGHYFIKDLDIETKYDIMANYDGYSDLIATANTSLARPYCEATIPTQTTVLIKNIRASEDITAKPDEVGVWKDDTYYKVKFGGDYTVRGFAPGTLYYPWLYARYGDKIITDVMFGVRTLELSPGVSVNAGPTTAHLHGTYVHGDVKVKRAWFTGYDDEGADIVLTGLDPETNYSATFNVMSEDGSITSATVKFTTKKLTLETLQPKCVSSTNSIVAAKTNMDDAETNAGFQWRKYDAPAELKSNEAFAGIYDGQMEGYIKKLQSDKYYKVRAFYISRSGNLYTGEWVTFDPSDFSFFQPTVHTYAVTNLTDVSARVRGYVLQGTEDIIEQGIQYWRTSQAHTKNRVLAKAPAAGVNTLYVSGQVMSVVISDLLPSTQYTYRAFVTTASGTIYGEEMTFTTEVSSGIEAAPVDDVPVTITGYYDLNGMKSDKPRRGVNIVRYSDGSTRKVMVK